IRAKKICRLDPIQTAGNMICGTGKNITPTSALTWGCLRNAGDSLNAPDSCGAVLIIHSAMADKQQEGNSNRGFHRPLH
ncbi:MAG TPA: hypothetical protein PKX74_17695, partial [Leptospiraceae bacterium]|nr:hypothetical protein [Leptospiraceae bacterium]